MKRILLALVLAALFAAPAEAHRWSYDNAYNDAWWSMTNDCGGGAWICERRIEPWIYACTEHSWCWSRDHYSQYTERNFFTGWRHDCHQHGKQYHGVVYVESRDNCYATYP